VAWIVRILLLVATPIAAWFVARDATNFSIVQMLVSILLLVGFVGALAFWPARWKR
jgi:hypothetical protein